MVPAYGGKTDHARHQIVNGLQLLGRRWLDDPFQLTSGAFPADLLIHQQGDRHALQCALWQTRPANNMTGLVAYVLSPARNSIASDCRASRGPGQIGGSPGNAHGDASTADVFRFLGRQHDRFVWIESLFALFAAREIALHRRSRAKPVDAQQRLQCSVDLGQKVSLYLLAIVQRGFRRLRIVGQRRSLSRAIEQISAHIHNGNGLRRKTFHRAGSQLADRHHILRGEQHPGPELYQDASLGRLTRLQEYGFFWESDVNARLLHFRERHDGALQFTFERAMIVDLLGEIAGAEVGFVE